MHVPPPALVSPCFSDGSENAGSCMSSHHPVHSNQSVYSLGPRPKPTPARIASRCDPCCHGVGLGLGPSVLLLSNSTTLNLRPRNHTLFTTRLQKASQLPLVLNTYHQQDAKAEQLRAKKEATKKQRQSCT